MLDVRRLVMLREVKLRGSITGAAQALSYTHSAISQQLSQLEREAGVQLLEKVGRGVRLTPAAEELVHHVDEILNRLERAQADLASHGTAVRGVLRLAAFTTLSRRLIPETIAALQTDHPQLSVRFRQSDPEPGLLLLSSHRIDALVIDSYPGNTERLSREFHSTLLIRDPLRAYLPAGSDSGTTEGLVKARWIVEPQGSGSRAWVMQACNQQGFVPDVTYESADLLFHLRMVETGLAAAYLPDTVVSGTSLHGRALTWPKHDQAREISLVCRAGAEHGPLISACTRELRRQLDLLPDLTSDG